MDSLKILFDYIQLVTELENAEEPDTRSLRQQYRYKTYLAQRVFW
jgi:hypothetical protein